MKAFVRLFAYMLEKLKWMAKGAKIAGIMNSEMDKILILVVLLACFGCLVAYNGNHDMLIYFEGAATTVLGCLLGMVQNKQK